MKLIVAGSRKFFMKSYLFDVLNYHMKKDGISEIISGGAEGADALGEDYAHLCRIPLKEFNPNLKDPDWKQINVDMVNYGDSLICFWDGVSVGTKHIIDLATEKGLPVYIYKFSNGEQKWVYENNKIFRRSLPEFFIETSENSPLRPEFLKSKFNTVDRIEQKLLFKVNGVE